MRMARETNVDLIRTALAIAIETTLTSGAIGMLGTDGGAGGTQIVGVES
jgi:hypothetical protein